MKRQLLFLTITFTLSLLLFSSYAQESKGRYSIQGVVKEEATKEPILDVIVRLELKNKLIENYYSEKGIINMSVSDTGSYTLSIYRIGYITKDILVKITPSTITTNLDVIILVSKNTTLNQVEVVGKKPLITQQIDRIIYDVQGDSYMKSLNVYDALKRVPLVSVFNNNVTVKGNGNITILINGRKTLANSSPAEYLSGLEASNVQSIEVITDPSSKYDAEGSSAIINIVTIKPPLGYRINTSIFARNPEYYRLRTFAEFTFKKFNFSVSLTPFKAINPTAFSTVETKTVSGDLIKQYGQNRYNSKNFLGSVELGYIIDSLSLLSTDFSFNNGKYNRYSQFDSDISGLNNSNQTYTQSIYSLQDRSINALNLNYQKSLRNTKGNKINLSYYFGRAKNDNENENVFSYLINYSQGNYFQNNYTDAKEHSGQFDYSGKYKSVVFETGVKGIYRTNSSDYFNQSLLTNSIYNNGDFIFGQQIYSAYGSLQYNINKSYSLRLGMRFENTDISIHNSSNSNQVGNDYLSFIPNFLIQKTLKNSKQIKFGYSQSISRPGISYLSPFVGNLNQNQVTIGNPNLKPVKYHKLNLEYSSFNKSSVVLGLNYNITNNEIVTIAKALGNNVIQYSFENIGSRKEVRANTFLGKPLSKKINLNVDGYVSYISLSGTFNNEYLKTNGFYLFSTVLASYKITPTLNFDAYLVYTTPNITLQTDPQKPFIDNSFGLAKSFLKRSLTLNLTAENPFMKFRRTGNQIVNPLFIQNNTSRSLSHAYSITLSYRFGKYKNPKKIDKKIKNNDIIENTQ